MTDAIRTPDVLLEGLPGLPLGAAASAPSTGCGSPTSTRATARRCVMLHGEPTWSYLWRKVAAAGARGRPPRDPARPAGLRPLGQADRRGLVLLRPPRRGDGATLLEDLDLRDATFVLHDWGGPIGLRLAVEHPERVDRLVLMDTGLFTGEQPMSEAWHRFARLRRPRRRSCRSASSCAAAAPPTRATRSPPPTTRRSRTRRARPGARAFPAILPLTPDDAGRRRRARACWRRCASDRRPMLMLWGAEDRPLPPRAGEAFAAALGRPAPRLIEGAGHYLQEDQGEQIGATIADWLAELRPPASSARRSASSARRRPARSRGARLVGRAGALVGVQRRWSEFIARETASRTARGRIAPSAMSAAEAAAAPRRRSAGP